MTAESFQTLTAGNPDLLQDGDEWARALHTVTQEKPGI